MFAMAAAGLALFVSTYVQNPWLLGALLALCFGLADANMGPAWAACADVGERYTGAVSGAMNMLGSLLGVVGTQLTGRWFHSGHPEWVFLIFSASYGVAALCWLGIDVSKPLRTADAHSPTPANA